MAIEIVSPFPEHSWPRVWSWIQPFRDRVLDDFSPQTIEDFVAARLSAPETEQTWGVLRDGELGGMVTFQRLSPVLGTCHCVFKKDLWGHSTTVPALRQIAEEVFSTGVNKLTLPLMRGNRAMAAILSMLGGYQEGILKQQTQQHGKPADMVLYALTREGFERSQYAGRDSSGDADQQRGRSGNEYRGISPRVPIQNQHADQHANAVA